MVASSYFCGGVPASSPKMLVMSGSPGIGKSTSVHVISKELSMDVLTWNDDHRGVLLGANDTSTSKRGQLSSFEEFLNRCSIGYNSLDQSSSLSSLERKSKRYEQSNFSCGLSFKRTKRSKIEENQTKKRKRAVILIEDIPNLHTKEAELRFRKIITHHVQTTQVPTIMIFSDVYEGQHRPEDIERLIDPSLLVTKSLPSQQACPQTESTLQLSPLVSILQIRPVPLTRMKKCLSAIISNERLNQSISNDFYEEIHSCSNGDLRQAIMTLEFRYRGIAPKRKGNTGKSKLYSMIRKTSDLFSQKRDTQLSPFHALGKILYAKREQGTNNIERNHGEKSLTSSWPIEIQKQWIGDSQNALKQPLTFDPDNVVENSPMGLSGSLFFLGYHAPDFFTDISELSSTLDTFSDAASFLDNTNNFGGRWRYLDGRNSGKVINEDSANCIQCYASSLTGRAVANYNLHPAPNKFRPLSAPKIFDVLKRTNANGDKITRLCYRISNLSRQYFFRSNVQISSCFKTFAVDSLPYLKKIIPNEIDHELKNIYSCAMYAVGGGNTLEIDDTEQELLQVLKNQQTILKEDDIIDDESIQSDKDEVSLGTLRNPQDKLNVDNDHSMTNFGAKLQHNSQTQDKLKADIDHSMTNFGSTPQDNSHVIFISD
eukprot:CAMPEP_0184864928 /NCGR_PEP_ID=MMETSP0580-20130426/16393_1 /TAXON_ID=1118495 /ORGANISM="Dactyliosolen fragilissimus" /LENGTH=655 /DNA_ID=CAMNT_0027363893 /DNA_START=401 /DNA_END=2368 /DNA_ORIENTATION=+